MPTEKPSAGHLPTETPLEFDIREFLRAREEDDLSFFAYRLPGSDVIEFSLARVAAGIHTGSFLVAPFINPVENIRSLIPVDSFSESTPAASEQSRPTPLPTTEEKHREGVINIRERLLRLGHGKCVLSRVIIRERRQSLAASFASLCSSRPDAFIFLFRLPEYGTWIGASPEILLIADQHQLRTMSLAGTRPATTASSSEPWDDKNLEEQRLVTDFITGCFRQNELQPTVGQLHTHKAGPVEHLCNDITAETTSLSSEHLSRLLHDLSPTPALCGSPREEALNLIKANEDHDRLLYGGFIGPFHSTANFNLFVNLRSARLTSTSYCQFVGGGITRFSDPASEWLETTRKAASLPCL